MAELHSSDGATRRVLLSQHLVGRSPECALRLTKSYVSAQHALIRWHERHWEVLDRGSLNGTKLDGVALEPGRPYRLSRGALLSFGHADETWLVADTQPPVPMALDLEDGSTLMPSHGMLGLPNSSAPELTIFSDGDGVWSVETSDGVVRILNDGETLECAGRRYRFCAARSSDATANVAASQEERSPKLYFRVSSDEEFVEVAVDYGARRVSLGARGHNYLLLTLARSYLSDRARGIADSSSGWVDKEELAAGLRMTPQQVDGEVFRIRRHFSQHGVSESSSIIERRPRTRQIRIGIPRVEIERA
jgi:hypothetical protein